MIERIIELPSDTPGSGKDQVVRCRDCQFLTKNDEHHGDKDWCDKHGHASWSRKGFCYWGERHSE